MSEGSTEDAGTGAVAPETRTNGETPAVASTDTAEQSPTDVAEQLLVATRTGEDPDPYLSSLAEFDEGALAPLREDRATALAFWLNCYNAGTQLLLDRQPGRYESSLRVVRFFRAPCLAVGGTSLSLDDIEHGILRGSQSKYGLGYLPRFPRGGFERRYRLADPDPRVHFALNCGAASCPAIRAYEPEQVDEQLDLATRVYLEETVEYDESSGVARVPRVFLWYRGDFGGGSGIRSLLREYEAVPADASPRLKHRSWDWSRTPGKFVE